jgi:ATP-binding cassette, subfamily C, bacterial CydC
VTGTLWRLLALAEAPRRRVALAVALGAATVLCGVGLMATAGYLISRAAERPAILSLGVAIVGVRFFGISRPLARYGERLASHDVALRALGRIRVRVYERIEPLAPAQLAGYRQGELLSRTVADVDALQNLHLRGVMPPLVALLAGAASVGVAAAFLPAAGVVLAAGLLLGGVAVPVLAGGLADRATRRQAAARGKLAAEILELSRGAAELVVYGRETEQLQRLRTADGALVRVAARDALAGGVGEGLGIFVTGATVAGVLAVGVSAHATAGLNSVLIATLALLAMASFEGVQPLAGAARDLSATLGAGRRVLALMDREPAVRDPDPPAPAPTTFDLALEGVWARYGSDGSDAPGVPTALAGSDTSAADVTGRSEAPDGPYVLRGLDLGLPAGRRLALVGESGAGKTTVVNLLLRFLDPERGRVTLGGRDLRDYRQQDVRHALAVAGQEAHLFSASILENVRLARPDATDAEIESALRRTRIWEWIATLPDGWDTLVGEEGHALSGGQRQRVGLARALLADAPVLVLDEPTAHLDPRTARELMRDVFVAAEGKSVLLITHRPEGLDLVDEVLALVDGRAGGAPLPGLATRSRVHLQE